MRKLFLQFLFFLPLFASAQKLRANFSYKVIYKLSFQVDSTDVGSKKSEYMMLFLGDEVSEYISRAKTLANRVVREGNTAHTSRSALTNFHYEIIKENTKNKLYYTLPIVHEKFYYVEDEDLMKWKISSQTKKIKDYKVQKATTTFAGRDYVAWFAPEIPISDGPYKFNGLPGLILEIYDSKKYWDFEFFGFEKLSPKNSFKINLNQYAKTTKEDLLSLWYRYRLDPMGYADNPNTKIDPEVHKKYIEDFTKMLNKENNPIELK